MIDNFQDSFERAVSDQRLDDIDMDYYDEGIQSQLDELLSNSSKKNYLKKFEKKIEECGLYEDEVNSAKESMYNKVIDSIAARLEFTVDKENAQSLRLLAKHLYHFFVLDYTINLTYFLEMYILENKKDILNELEEGPSIQLKRIEGIDGKIAIILNNISEVIRIIANSGITFDEYIDYINSHPESNASVNEMIEYDRDVLDDTDNTFSLIMDDLVNEEEGFGKIYTDLQLNIFSRFKAEDF